MLRLMLLNGEARGVRFEVAGDVPVFIGRHAMGVDHVDSRMSRQHAEVWREGGVWLLRDLNSTNGTFINGEQVQGLCELELGDHIRCGRTEFVVADLRAHRAAVADTLTHGHADATAGDTALHTDLAEPPTEPSPRDGFRRTRGGEARAIITTAIEENAEGTAPPASSGLAADSTGTDSSPPAAAAQLVTSPDAPATVKPVTAEVAPDAPEQPSAHEASGSHELLRLDEEAPPAPTAADAPSLQASSDEAPAAPSTPTGRDLVSLAEDNRDLPAWGRQSLRDRKPQRERGKNPSNPPGPAEVAARQTGPASPPRTRPTPTADAVPPATIPDDDEYAAPQVVGLSLGHTPPVAPPSVKAAPPSPVGRVSPASAPEEDSSAPDTTPDNPQVSARAGWVPPAPAEPTPSPTGEPAEDPPPVSQAERSTDEDEDVLKLGFTGTERPSEALDEPALRGQVSAPGRFVVTESDDDHDEAVGPSDGFGRFERRALLSAEPTDEDFDARPSRALPNRSWRKLPVALAGLTIVGFVVAAFGYAMFKQGLLPENVAGRSPSASPENARKQPADPASDAPPLVLADTAETPAGIPSDAPSHPLIRPGQTPATAPPAVAPAPGLPTRSTAPAADLAFDSGPGLLSGTTIQAESSATAVPPAATPSPDDAATATRDPALPNAAPRVATSEELAAIVAAAQARRAAAPPVDQDAPADPVVSLPNLTQDAGSAEASTDPDAAKAFAWSGLTVGSDDSIFTRPAVPGPSPWDADEPQTASAEPGGAAVSAPVAGEDTAPNNPRAAVELSSRRVVYLVDTSGTMVDSMPQLRTYLADAIDRLDPGQRFTVVLYRQGEATELPPAGLRPATVTHKAAARRWLAEDAGNIRLGGRSDPTAALSRVLGYGLDDIVIFSDDAFGKRVKPGGADLTIDDLGATLAEHDEVRLHTVQFFYNDPRDLLRRLAVRFGGEHEFVREITDANPEAPDILGAAYPR